MQKTEAKKAENKTPAKNEHTDYTKSHEVKPETKIVQEDEYLKVFAV